MQEKGFIFYRSFYDALKMSTPKVRLEVVDAICRYSFEGTVPKMSSVADALFTLIKPQLDANSDRYEKSKRAGRPVQITEDIKKQIVFDYEHGTPIDELVKKYSYSQRSIYNVVSLQKSIIAKDDFAKNEIIAKNEIAKTQTVLQKSKIEKENKKEIEKENKERENKKEIPTPAQSYGIFENVVLSDEEYTKLKVLYPDDYTARIDNLSAYIQKTGNNYSGEHMAVIVKWASEDNRKVKNNGGSGKKYSFTDMDSHSYSDKDFENMFDDFTERTE